MALVVVMYQAHALVQQAGRDLPAPRHVPQVSMETTAPESVSVIKITPSLVTT